MPLIQATDVRVRYLLHNTCTDMYFNELTHDTDCTWAEATWYSEQEHARLDAETSLDNLEDWEIEHWEISTTVVNSFPVRMESCG